MNYKQQTKNSHALLRLYNLCTTGFLVLTFAGCAGIGSHVPDINGIVIRNQTTDTLNDVRIQVNKTGAFAHCSHVYSGSECSTTFRSKPYRGNPVVIRWQQAGIEHQSEELHASLPAGTEPGLKLRVHIVIAENRDASVSLAP